MNEKNSSAKETKESSLKNFFPFSILGSSNKSPVPATASPTSENSYAVRPPPYALSYSFDETVEDPSPEDFAELADVTRLFLETYMVNRFDQTSIILLDDFLTFMTRYDAGSRPVIAAYRWCNVPLRLFCAGSHRSACRRGAVFGKTSTQARPHPVR